MQKTRVGRVKRALEELAGAECEWETVGDDTGEQEVGPLAVAWNMS